MSEVFNIYCDESCHLENDRQPVMVLGAVWCPASKAREVAERVREIKVQHGLSPRFELKWGKVSPALESFYREVLDYFFDYDGLRFRCLVVPDKAKLRHDAFGQSHDTWYYKMYFDLLKVILDPNHCYRIYLDIKDTRSADKVRKLHDVLCNSMYDFNRTIIERVQTVHSHEVEQVQMADLLIGIISYVNRSLGDSSAKVRLVERMRKRSGYALTRTTLLREEKVNIFVWKPQEELQ